MKIVVRGAGDLATAVIYKLYKSGYEVIALESETPSAIRREVAFSEAVYKGTMIVEGVRAYFAKNQAEALRFIEKGPVILVDPDAELIESLHPDIVIDGIIAKKNLGTNKTMAPLTIALGPGFEAGKDVDYVIETMRGHDLGRILTSGHALPNTGMPGRIAGVDKERVIHSPFDGIWISGSKIGDYVEAGQSIGMVKETAGIWRFSVETEITGILRGVIPDGYQVHRGLKIADVDPRKEEQKNCYTISDKGRCIAGSVLELVVAYEKRTISKNE